MGMNKLCKSVLSFFPNYDQVNSTFQMYNFVEIYAFSVSFKDHKFVYNYKTFKILVNFLKLLKTTFPLLWDI